MSTQPQFPQPQFPQPQFPFQPQPVAPTKFTGLAWVAFALGLAGFVLIPVPLLNNAGALAAVAGVVCGIIAVFGTRKGIAVTGLVLSLVGIVGTLMIQAHWAAELDKIM